MKLFSLVISAVILTTNPLFAMDRLEDGKPCGGPKQRFVGQCKETVEVQEVRKWMDMADSLAVNNGLVLIDNKKFKLNRGPWAEILLAPLKEGQTPSYCSLSDMPRPKFETLYANTTRLSPKDKVTFRPYYVKGDEIHYRATFWNVKDELVLIPIEYTQFGGLR